MCGVKNFLGQWMLWVGLVVVWWAQPNLRAQENWKPLFNGKDLSGWVVVNVAPNTFTAREGMIVSTGKPTGTMRTERMYENFIVELEWGQSAYRAMHRIKALFDPEGLLNPGVLLNADPWNPRRGTFPVQGSSGHRAGAGCFRCRARRNSIAPSRPGLPITSTSTEYRRRPSAYGAGSAGSALRAGFA